VNAILGIKSLNTKETIPALLAMLHDPNEEVRQVANFALQSLTGEKFKLPSAAGRTDYDHLAEEWHQWWLAHAANFVPQREAPCHDW
jgi:HEAT repeat protein